MKLRTNLYNKNTCTFLSLKRRLLLYDIYKLKLQKFILNVCGNLLKLIKIYKVPFSNTVCQVIRFN